MSNSLIVFYIVASIVFASAFDYCSDLNCGEGVKHIACGHNGNFADSCPADAVSVNIDDNLQSLIVNAHNAKRNFIAGGGDAKHSPACRMATIEWDDELASLAALNVKQCDMSHDSCHNTDAYRYSGQNLAWITYYETPNDTALLQEVVEMWYNEVNNSKMDYIDKFPNGYKGPDMEHFTVMVADRNIRVGCAASTYSISGQSYKAYLVACNYATTNLIDSPIYASCSKAASSCTSGVNPNYSNLCSSSEVYDVNEWF